MITGDFLMREGLVMNRDASHKRLVCSVGFVIVLIVLFSGGSGCGKKESPAPKGGLEFKKQIGEMLQKLESLLLESASKEDRKTAETTLEKFASEAFQKNWVRPLLMGLIDKRGIVLARWPGPVSFDSGNDFAQYNAFKRVLKDRKIFQEKLFLQGGQNTLLLCVPLLRKGELEAILAFTFRPADLKEHMGLTEEGFLAMDFNP
jgi:hypothetical protein